MQNFQKKILSVIGLGYVGFPLAVAFAKKFRVIGFDINKNRIEELKCGIDRTGEVSASDLKETSIQFTSNFEELKEANFHIVAVPTPVDSAKQPNLKPLLEASRTVGQILKKRDIVVYESTVYPGATEEDCLPVLEKTSGLKSGVDFKIGYSPERINPGDKEHTFTRIKKVVSGQDEMALEEIAATYSAVVEAGVFRAQSIKVAEAAKVIENTQRDLNIALMNELSLIFDLMNIDTQAVLQAASTKWNFLRFFPGLVGGHCIGVDPYYLTHKAERMGYHPQVILAGRRINDGMGKFIAQKAIKNLLRAGHHLVGSTITVLGFTFKENCPDTRNTKVIDIVREFEENGIKVQVCDPIADADEAFKEYGIQLVSMDKLKHTSAVVVAVAHTLFRDLKPEFFKIVQTEIPVLIDVKGIFSAEKMAAGGVQLWRL